MGSWLAGWLAWRRSEWYGAGVVSSGSIVVIIVVADNVCGGIELQCFGVVWCVQGIVVSFLTKDVLDFSYASPMLVCWVEIPVDIQLLYVVQA
jgi:hypothetical protein